MHVLSPISLAPHSHLTLSAVALGLSGFNCMGETALHLMACRGDLAAVRALLPKCDAKFIMSKSEFRLTEGFDALHTALVFQQLDIADAILERLEQIWGAQPPADGLQLLKELLTVHDPVTRTTTVMLMCRCSHQHSFRFACNVFVCFYSAPSDGAMKNCGTEWWSC
jgi:hypothetical protein